jgi:hypothetical protein
MFSWHMVVVVVVVVVVVIYVVRLTKCQLFAHFGIVIQDGGWAWG